MALVADILPSAALETQPAQTVFWSGAGISVDPPTSAPKATELVARAFEHCFDAGTANVIAGYYRRLDVPRSDLRPRLETVLDVVNRIHGDGTLRDLLSDLAVRPPNPLHRFFAAHLLAGGRHVTTNFDTCIETAASRPVPVVHVHGSLAGGDLGATLARIERGLPIDTREAVMRVLSARDTRLVVFVGYSGSDFFDVDPFLRALAPASLAGRDVLWVNHSKATAAVPPTRQQLEWLSEAGASVSEVDAPTREVLTTFGERWGIALRDDDSDGRRDDAWRLSVGVTDEQRERATLELYAVMGLHREVDKMLPAPRDESEAELLAHTRWAQGRYEDAGRAWRARAGASEAAQIERAAAVLWIRGQYRQAAAMLVAALRDGGAPEEKLLLAETLARVYDHAQRYPDTRGLADERLRRFTLDQLPDPDELAAEGTPLGIHLRSRVRSARAALGVAAPASEDAILSFGEYEALSAQLNYRHSELRDRRRHEHVDPLELQELRGSFEIIGADGDAARTTLLGGLGAFSWKDVCWAPWRLDVTLRHRLRLLLSSLGQSLCHWLNPPPERPSRSRATRLS